MYMEPDPNACFPPPKTPIPTSPPCLLGGGGFTQYLENDAFATERP